VIKRFSKRRALREKEGEIRYLEQPYMPAKQGGVSSLLVPRGNEGVFMLNYYPKGPSLKLTKATDGH